MYLMGWLSSNREAERHLSISNPYLVIEEMSFVFDLDTMRCVLYSSSGFDERFDQEVC